MPAQLYKSTSKNSKQLKTKPKTHTNKQKTVTSLNILAWAIFLENQIQFINNVRIRSIYKAKLGKIQKQKQHQQLKTSA